VSPRVSASDWEAFLSSQPQAHLLQTAAWGELKSRFGWRVERVLVGAGGAQVLFRRLPLGLTLAYIPKGPVGDWLPGLLPDLDALCREWRAFALKIEPDLAADAKLVPALRSQGFRPSRHTVQPPRTLVVDLRSTEEAILARMLQKTRYNIGLAVRKGVSVRVWDDLEGFCRMMQTTAERDRFGSHTPAYYRLAYDLFHELDACEMLVAEAEGEPLAAAMVFARGPRAWYFYGASSDRERNRMPTYLLQWQAMRWARARGCASYDLWGVPDAERDRLEAHFASRSDGLWGVYRFKRGFGGELVRSAGAWDRPYNTLLYALYRLLIARRSRE
jgi:peptidoglycan pentaglycine glycine transferase (the first glycine)